MPLYRSPVSALNGFQGNHHASPRVFGAKADGTTNDLVAIQNTINHLKSLPGGGTLVIDGIYRVTDTIEMDSKVSIAGVGSGITANSSSALLLDHATHSLFNWGSISSGFGYTRQRISNLLLGGLQSNNANVFNHQNNHPLDLVVENITHNEGPSAGLLNGYIWDSAINSKLVFRDCSFNQTVSAPSLFRGNNSDDTLTLDNCRLASASGINSRAVDMQSGRLGVFGCDLLSGGSPAGGAAWLHTGAAGSTRAVGNTFRAFGGAVPSFTWQAGARLVEGSNTYDGTSAIFTLLSGTPAVLAAGSRIEPQLHLRRSSPSALWDLDDYVETFSYEMTGGAALSLTLPKGYVPGQRCRVMLLNSTGGTLTIVFTPNNVIGGSSPNLSSGKSASYDFVFANFLSAGSYSWSLTNSSYN